MRTEDFFAFARERHATYIRRASGEPGPWTDDPILREYRFTNVFRELDKTTIWFRKNIRDWMRDHMAASIFSTIAFRWFNRIETGQRIIDDRGQFAFSPVHWDSAKVDRVVRPHTPWVTGAYIIKTPNGKDKLEGVLWCIDQIHQDLGELTAKMHNATLEEAWKLLLPYPFMGPFMAYEAVTDLRHTCVLEDASDIMTWANPGPGARRGLARLEGSHRDANVSTRASLLNRLMEELLEASRDERNWPQGWGTWEMRDVEHTLCEFDKYERVRTGEGRPRGRFSMPG